MKRLNQARRHLQGAGISHVRSLNLVPDGDMFHVLEIAGRNKEQISINRFFILGSLLILSQ